MHQISRRDLLRAGAGFAFLSGMANGSRSKVLGFGGQYDDTVLVTGAPPAAERRAFTIAVLPDTQYYSDKNPRLFTAQTEWLVANKQRHNIVAALHLGDITDKNTTREWENARTALNVLDGEIPYFLTLGNHDYSEGGSCQDRTTLFNDFFPVAKFRDQQSFGGTYDAEPDRMENSYHTFSAAGRKFLVLALEFGPRQDVVRWANEVVTRHADHLAILVTHAYTYHDSKRHDWQRQGERQQWNPHSYPIATNSDDYVMDGEELWTNLVSRHNNFLLTLNGHVLGNGLGRLSSPTVGGRNVHQMLVNYQMRPNGGDGFLRLMEFRPRCQMVQVYDYSPTRGQCNTSPQSEFTLKLA